MQEEVKHYKVKSLGTQLRPNSVYYVKPNSQTAVLTYITDQTGIPYPLIDLTGAGNVQTVTGTGVTGTLTNPVVNISTFNSSQLGNLIQLSSTDGKLFVKPITSPDGSISITNTLSELQIEVSEALQTQIQNALQPGANISELTNNVGYITQDDVEEYTNLSSFPITGVIGTIYIALDTGLFYSWNGTTYIPSSAPDTGITGGGTIDTIPRFTPTGAQIGNSVIAQGSLGEVYINKLRPLISGISRFSIQRAQSQIDFALGNGVVGDTSELISDITTSFNIKSKGELALIAGNTYSNEGLRVFSSGKLKFTQTPGMGSTSDKIIVRDSFGEVKQIDYPTIPTVGNWGALNYPTWTTGTPFVKMTAAGTFALDTNTYLTSAVTSVGATSPITSSGGNTPTISTSMSTNKLIGRSTAGTGVMEEISIGSGLSLSAGTLSTNITSTIPHATAVGTDTYTATITGVTAYADGDAYLIRFTNGNTTGATLNINTLGAIPLYRNNDGILLGGDIVDGAEMLCVYNSTTIHFQVIGVAPNTLIAYVTNDDSVTITKGQAVYAFSGTGDRMTVKRASNTGDATSAQTVGLVLSTSIAANQKGLIMMQGLLDGLSILPTATWSDGDPVYLGATAGSITKVKPYAPNHLVYLGVVTTASNGSAGRMYVKVQNGYELDELHNVQAQSPSLKDTLWYDNTVSPAQWKTASISTILGYTPGTVSSVAALTLGTTGTDLSSTVANSTTTPVITLNVPTASASNRGVLSSTDWSTFNNKQNNLRTFNTIQGIYYFEDFMGSLGANINASVNSIINVIGNGQGTTRTTANITNRTNQQGVVESLTSANTTGQAGYIFGGTSLFIGNGSISIETYINITTLSNSTDRFFTFFGYMTGSNFNNPGNCAVITYDEGAQFLFANGSTFFKCVNRAGGTATTTITNVTVNAGQWYKLRIDINSNASSITYYIDGVLVATHNTNIPLSTTAMYIASGLSKSNSSGTAARAFQTDYFMYEEIFTNPR